MGVCAGPGYRSLAGLNLVSDGLQTIAMNASADPHWTCICKRVESLRVFSRFTPARMAEVYPLSYNLVSVCTRMATQFRGPSLAYVDIGADKDAVTRLVYLLAACVCVCMYVCMYVYVCVCVCLSGAGC